MNVKAVILPLSAHVSNSHPAISKENLESLKDRGQRQEASIHLVFPTFGCVDVVQDVVCLRVNSPWEITEIFPLRTPSQVLSLPGRTCQGGSFSLDLSVRVAQLPLGEPPELHEQPGCTPRCPADLPRPPPVLQLLSSPSRECSAHTRIPRKFRTHSPKCCTSPIPGFDPPLSFSAVDPQTSPGEGSLMCL